MEMDALTRQQAKKIEFVLRDLVRDVQLLSLMPNDLKPWTRRTCLEEVRARRADEKNGGFNADAYNDDADAYIAELIYDAAGHYGDPTDVDRNELLLQMTEFADVEGGILDSATGVGSVEETEMIHHHMLLRAVVDTLQDSNYVQNAQKVAETRCDAFAGRQSSAKFSVMDPGVAVLRQVLEALLGLVMARNATTVNEDMHNYKILHEAVNKEKTTSADVKALKREYQETKDAHKAEVAALNAEIRQLEEEIEYTNGVVAMELAAFYEVNAKIEEDRRVHDVNCLEDMKKLMQEADKRLGALVSKNQEEADALRTQRAKKEAAVSAAITEYDTQMTTLLEAASALNKEAEEDTEVIVGLEKELEVLRKEKGEYEVEKYIESIRNRQYEDMQANAQKYACTIQACFRSYMARLNFEKLQNSLKKRPRRKTG